MLTQEQKRRLFLIHYSLEQASLVPIDWDNGAFQVSPGSMVNTLHLLSYNTIRDHGLITEYTHFARAMDTIIRRG